MTGNFLLEKEDYDGALKNYLTSKEIYTNLSSIESLHNTHMYKYRIEVKVEPLIQACQRFVTGGGLLSQEEIDQLSDKSLEGQEQLKSLLTKMKDEVRSNQKYDFKIVEWNNSNSNNGDNSKITIKNRMVCSLMDEITEMSEEFNKIKNNKDIISVEQIQDIVNNMLRKYDEIIQYVEDENKEAKKNVIPDKEEECMRLEAYFKYEKLKIIVYIIFYIFF